MGRVTWMFVARDARDVARVVIAGWIGGSDVWEPDVGFVVG